VSPPTSSLTGAALTAARIVRRQDFTDDLFVLWLESDIALHFTPGQYVTIGARGIERPYSIASAPHEPLIELFLEFVLPEHGGILTPILWAGHVGDMLTMRPKPKGRFTFRAGTRNHVMVGTVTGVAPYVSMVRHFVHERQTGVVGLKDYRFFVMEGASHRDEFVYDREFQTLSNLFPGVIRYVCSVSRPQAERNAGWAGPTGRINLLIEEYLDRWKLPREETVIYLCGNPGMIDDARARLIPCGWSVLAERFWPR
jgi:ferredoxin--NADP+ reductase